MSFRLLSRRRLQSKFSTSLAIEHMVQSPRPSSLDVQFVDFDGVRFHLSTPERKTSLLLSMHIRCWDELVKYGALDILKREYGALLVAQPEHEYNVSLVIDLEQVPTDAGNNVNQA